MIKFIRGIKNIITWLPIIWKSKNDNYNELYDIIIHKINLMANNFEKHDTTNQDKIKLVKDMRNNAIRLKYAKNETFVQIASNKYKHQYYIDMTKCTDDDTKKEIITTFKLRLANARRLDNINRRKAFKVLGESINTWRLTK